MDLEKLKIRIKMSRATESGITIPVPNGLELRPYQKAAIEYHISNHYLHSLWAYPPGLGKTIIAIALANLLKFERILIIAPTSLLINWQKEIEKWSLLPNKKICRVKKGRDIIPKESNFIIISYGMLSAKDIEPQINFRKFDLIIIDEVHMLKNMNAERTRRVYGHGMHKGYATLTKHLIGLSGTPFSNRPSELFSTIKAFCHDAISRRDFWSYAKRYCGAFLDNMGHWDCSGASNQKELGILLRGHFMARCKKEEVLKDLPPLSVNIVFLEHSKESKKIINRMAEFSIEEITGGFSASSDGISLDRKALGLTKVVPALDYLINQLDFGRDKIVVFAHHREVVEALTEGLKEYGAVKFYGGMSAEQKDSAVVAFQEYPSTRVFVGSIVASGMGITLTASSYVAIVEASYVPGENKQAIDRLHRIGQLNNVEAEFLTFENSLDENIIKAHILKNMNIKQILFD